MNYKVVFCMMMLWVIVCCSVAAPTMNPITDTTARRALFSATGALVGSDAWFQWGSVDGYEYWKTPNQTVGATGNFNDYQDGPPMLSGQDYHVKACDETGCSATVGFTVPGASEYNYTSFGYDVQEMQRGGMNVTQIMPIILKPYTMTNGTVKWTMAVSWGLMFLFIFGGMWLREGDVLIPCILAMVSAGALWIGGAALGVPPDFRDLGQGLMYASIAGVIFSWFSR